MTLSRNGWDSRGCVDVFGRRRDCHVMNLMQSVYWQEGAGTARYLCNDSAGYA